MEIGEEAGLDRISFERHDGSKGFSGGDTDGSLFRMTPE